MIFENLRLYLEFKGSSVRGNETAPRARRQLYIKSISYTATDWRYAPADSPSVQMLLCVASRCNYDPLLMRLCLATPYVCVRSPPI